MPLLSAGVEEIRRRAELAAGKKPPLGPDLDLGRYRSAEKGSAGGSPCRESLVGAGIEPEGHGRAGTYLQADRDALLRHVGKRWEGRVEIMPVAEALASRTDAADAWWRFVPPDADKFTALTALGPDEGYYIGILPGENIAEPLQSCLLKTGGGSLQGVHNIIVAGERSRAHIITGCTSIPGASEGLHLGVTECVVRPGASLTFTMIHNWGEGYHVRSRSKTVVEEGGTFVSNYVLLRPLRSIQMFPVTVLRGTGARCRFQSLMAGRGVSVIDVGSQVVHEGADTRSESVSRAIASGESSITARGRIQARTNSCRGHLDCRGMIRSEGASIVAVPELDAQGAPQAELSHEAAISPIAEEEVAYLMSRGIPREEAVATITRGFLDVDLLGLPPPLRHAVNRHLGETGALPV